MASRTETVVATRSDTRRRVQIPPTAIRDLLGSIESLGPIRDAVAQMRGDSDLGGSSPRTAAEHVRATHFLSVVTGSTHKALAERAAASRHAVPFSVAKYRSGGAQVSVTVSAATSILTGDKGKFKSQTEELPLSFPVESERLNIERQQVLAAAIVADAKLRLLFSACQLAPSDHFLKRLTSRGPAAGIAYGALRRMLKEGIVVNDDPTTMGRMINAGASKRVIDVTRHLRGRVPATATVNFREYNLKFELSVELLTSFSVDGGDSIGKFVLRTLFNPADEDSGVRPFSYAVVFMCNCRVELSAAWTESGGKPVLVIENVGLGANAGAEQAESDDSSMLVVPITLIDNGGDTVIRFTQDGVAIDVEGGPPLTFETDAVSVARFAGGARLRTIKDVDASEEVVRAISSIKEATDGYTGILRKDMSPSAIAISKTGVERMSKGKRSPAYLLYGSFLFECSLLFHLVTNMKDPKLEGLMEFLRGIGVPGRASAKLMGERVVLRSRPAGFILPQDFVSGLTSVTKKSEVLGYGGCLIVESSSGASREEFIVPYGHFAKVKVDTGATLGSPTGPVTKFYGPLETVTRFRDGDRFLEDAIVTVISLMVDATASADFGKARRYLRKTRFDDLPEPIRLFALRRAEIGVVLREACETFFGSRGNLDVPSGFVTDHNRAAYSVNGREKMIRALLNRCFVGEAFSNAGRLVDKPSEEGVRASKASFAVRTFPPGPNQKGHIPVFTTTLAHRELFKSGERMGGSTAFELITLQAHKTSVIQPVRVVGFTRALYRKKSTHRGLFLRGIDISPTVFEAVRMLGNLITDGKLRSGTPVLMEMMSTAILIAVTVIGEGDAASVSARVAVSGAHRSSCWTTTKDATLKASRAEVMASWPPCG